MTTTSNKQWCYMEPFQRRTEQLGPDWMGYRATLIAHSLPWPQYIPSTHCNQNLHLLYLYIPPRSAHPPPSRLKGLITGELRWNWLQNSPKDFISISVKFIERLVDRGHQLGNLLPQFEQAASAVDSVLTSKNMIDSLSTLFIYWKYHPNEVQWSDIQILYNEILARLLNYNKTTAAISHPKSLREHLFIKPINPTFKCLCAKPNRRAYS